MTAVCYEFAVCLLV